MSSLATSSPVSASTLEYLMRWPVLRLIWLNETFSVSEVAGYSATGQVTSDNRRKPFQLARGAMANSENATGQALRIASHCLTTSDRDADSGNGVNCCRFVPLVRCKDASENRARTGTSLPSGRWLQVNAAKSSAAKARGNCA